MPADWAKIKDEMFPEAAFMRIELALALRVEELEAGDLMMWALGIESRDPWSDEIMAANESILRIIERVEPTDALPSFDYDEALMAKPRLRVVFLDEVTLPAVDRPYVVPAGALINVMRGVHVQI